MLKHTQRCRTMLRSPQDDNNAFELFHFWHRTRPDYSTPATTTIFQSTTNAKRWPMALYDVRVIGYLAVWIRTKISLNKYLIPIVGQIFPLTVSRISLCGCVCCQCVLRACLLACRLMPFGYDEVPSPDNRVGMVILWMGAGARDSGGAAEVWGAALRIRSIGIRNATEHEANVMNAFSVLLWQINKAVNWMHHWYLTVYILSYNSNVNRLV